MILTTLNDSQRIEPLHPLFKTLFDYVKSHNLLDAPLGRIEIDGDNLFINNSFADAVDRDAQVLEIHRKYIDVHILLQGNETIGWKPLSAIDHLTKPYDEEGDCELSDDRPTAFVDMLPGQVLVVYPEDPHAPVIGKGKIRKLIGKVRVL
ncbi:MAG: YhcH/YjgK/YiaL family protein [Muribaculaceae bacterium]